MRNHDLSIGMSFALASAVLFAKAATAGAPPVPSAPAVEGYEFAEIAMPEAVRVGGPRGEESKLAKALNAVPLSRSFLESVEVPASITDAAEREKAFKAEARKVTNRIGGAIRRLHKAHPERNFGIRTISDPNSDLGKHGLGVRVWRLNDSTAEELADKAKKLAERKTKAQAQTPPPPPAPTA